MHVLDNYENFDVRLQRIQWFLHKGIPSYPYKFYQIVTVSDEYLGLQSLGQMQTYWITVG